MFNEADAVTADSKALIDEVNKISSRINHYVPWAIDSDRFTPEADTKPALDMLKGLDPSNTNIIISPRQWKQAGRIEAIVSSFKAILDRKMHPKEKCHAIFITYSTNGSEEHAKVKSFIEANLPSDSYTLFEDGVPWETMPSFLRLADCYVSAFRTDSNSCSLLESLSCGTPVVAVDNGNTAELRDKGWILESENPPSPLSLARDIQAAFGMARNRPFGLVEAFGLPVWGRFEDIYKECAKSARNAEWIDSYLEADSKVVLKPGKNEVPVNDALYLMRGMAYKSMLSGNINASVSNVSGWLNIAANSKPGGTVTLSRQGAREPDGSASRV
jgi:glycosyltransferase involved in cell wall biosynthesis